MRGCCLVWDKPCRNILLSKLFLTSGAATIPIILLGRHILLRFWEFVLLANLKWDIIMQTVKLFSINRLFETITLINQIF